MKKKISFVLLEQGFKSFTEAMEFQRTAVSDKRLSEAANASLKIVIRFYNRFFRQKSG